MDIGHYSAKASLNKNDEFFINPSVEELKEFAATRVMKDFQKNLGPEDQQPILTESERVAAIKKEKDEFENRKKIEVKGLPAEMKAEDVSGLLENYRVGPIQLEKVETSTNAVVMLGSGQEAENAVRELNGLRYNGCILQCSMASVDSLLCITNLPLSYTQENVRKMCEAYGPVDRCFVMPSEETGNSKGYAFVEYPNKDIARKAKTQLNGRLVQTHEINCDWTDENHCYWNKLHSTCLLAELTADFNDTTKFRSLFNKIADPRYIQLALNSETRKCLGFGIVAYENPLVTEQTWYKVNGANVYGQNLRVYFVCPGHSGRNEYTRRLAKCQKKSPQAVLGAPLFHSQFPTNGLLNPLLMAKFGGASSPVAAAVAGHTSAMNPLAAAAAMQNQAAAGSMMQPSISHAHQLVSQNQALLVAAAQQAALVGGGVPVNGMSPNAALLAAMASGQPTGAVAATHPHPHHPHPAGTQPGTPAHLAVSHQQQQAAALAAASLISSSPGAAGPGATPGGPGGAATSPHNMSSAAHQAATLQNLQQQLAAAASNGQQQSSLSAVIGAGGAGGPPGASAAAGSQSTQELAQAQMLALAQASNKDKTQQNPLHNPTPTSTISQNTSAANSLIQQNAQLKALGLIPHGSETSSAGAHTLDPNGLGGGASNAGLLAALAASQQQQLAALSAAAAQQGMQIGAGGATTAALPYQTIPGGMDIFQQAAALQQQHQQQQQQQQLLAAAQLSAAGMGGIATAHHHHPGAAAPTHAGAPTDLASLLAYQQAGAHPSANAFISAPPSAYISADQVVYDNHPTAAGAHNPSGIIEASADLHDAKRDMHHRPASSPTSAIQVNPTIPMAAPLQYPMMYSPRFPHPHYGPHPTFHHHPMHFLTTLPSPQSQGGRKMPVAPPPGHMLSQFPETKFSCRYVQPNNELVRANRATTDEKVTSESKLLKRPDCTSDGVYKAQEIFGAHGERKVVKSEPSLMKRSLDSAGGGSEPVKKQPKY